MLNIKTKLIGVLFLAVKLNTAVLAQTYQPPSGIPTPGFGLSEVAPPWPSGWPSSEVVSYYYIDNTHPNATNAFNNYGTPDRPRTSIPEITYPTGSYVEIHGGPYLGGGQIIFTGNGTETEPVWIRGASSSDKGDISGEMIVKGSYVIIENLVFSTDYAVVGVRPHNGSSAHHIAIRNNEMFGTGTDVGFRSAISVSGSIDFRFHDVVVYNNLIYSRGDYRPDAVENDYHGVAPNRNADRVWILNNEIHHMGGDSVQVGTANIADEQRVSHVYIADNNFYTNFENALDIKEANHVIAINNDFHDFAEAAVVIHNMGDFIWIVNNHVYNSPVGIVTSGSTNTWFIGNSVWNIHTLDSVTWNPNSGYSDGVAIHFRASDGGAVNNTLYNYDSGIQLTTTGPYELSNNIFFGRHQPTGYDLRIANSSVRSLATSNYNIYSDSNIDFGTGVNTTIPVIQSTYSQEQSTLEASPLVLNSGTNNFHLQPNSPAIDAGSESNAYALFFNQYGLEINKDRDGIARPVNSTWDIGAYEFSMDLFFINGFEQ